jgi:DNA-binding IclR family transcriptional regulator
MADPRYLVPGLERGLKLLQLFDRQRATLGATDIARLLAIPRSSAFRLIQTLEHLGFLERTGSEYRLAVGVLRLGLEYIASLPITELARPVLEGLRDQSGCSAQLALRDGTDVVFVVRVLGHSSFSSNVSVGTRMPAHATALGRALLLDLPERTLAALYAQVPMNRFSPGTPQTAAALARVLAEDRSRGYALSESAFEQGISAIAAPVRDGSGTTVAALSITVQHATLGPAGRREHLAAAVCEAAQALSFRLNYRPPAVAAGGPPLMTEAR